jgi:DNA invertase Pin-like site-specific DNA recombinase
VLEEHASGADRNRPVLARLLREIRPGETLVVVRLDRLACSVSHPFAVIEQLEAGGVQFRRLHDPIDISTPQGMFSLQVLGCRRATRKGAHRRAHQGRAKRSAFSRSDRRKSRPARR